jgi:hypothetical protein
LYEVQKLLLALCNVLTHMFEGVYYQCIEENL